MNYEVATCEQKLKKILERSRNQVNSNIGYRERERQEVHKMLMRKPPIGYMYLEDPPKNAAIRLR
jgi:hypothetical protein